MVVTLYVYIYIYIYLIAKMYYFRGRPHGTAFPRSCVVSIVTYLMYYYTVTCFIITICHIRYFQLKVLLLKDAPLVLFLARESHSQRLFCVQVSYHKLEIVPTTLRYSRI